MTEETQTAWACPKDGTAMEPRGRRGRGRVWRCPACQGIFLDVEAWRSGRQGQPLKWLPIVMSITMSIALTVLVRRLRRRSKEPST